MRSTTFGDGIGIVLCEPRSIVHVPRWEDGSPEEDLNRVLESLQP